MEGICVKWLSVSPSEDTLNNPASPTTQGCSKPSILKKLLLLLEVVAMVLYLALFDRTQHTNQNMWCEYEYGSEDACSLVMQ